MQPSTGQQNEFNKSYDLSLRWVFPGIAINDNFQVLDEFGGYNDRIFFMPVPFMAGYNPDYSGLDFCETASKFVVQSILED